MRITRGPAVHTGATGLVAAARSWAAASAAQLECTAPRRGAARDRYGVWADYVQYATCRGSFIRMQQYWYDDSRR